MATIKGGPNSAAVFEAVTPHASTNFTNGVSRGIYVGVAGNVAAVDVDGNVTVFTGATAGSILPIECKRINAISTTATNMVALF